MKKLITVCLALAVVMTTAPAQDLSEAVQAVKQEYQEAYSAWLKKARAADPKDRGELRKQMPQASKWGGKLIELAKTDAKSDAAFDALLWVTQRVRGGDMPKAAGKLIMEHHIEKEQLATLAMGLGRGRTPEGEASLKTLIEKSPHREVKGQAAFWLAYSLKYRGAPEAAEYYKLVIAEYGDLKSRRGTLGSEAQANLWEAETLAVGKTAPDIAAADTDGVDFKLSDYRGKVVMLDFWGHW